MQDRRQDIIEAGLATLREFGYGGFTQSRVAGRAGLRQSHLTYYYPTRLDLLAAVGRAVVDRQLAAVEATLSRPDTIEEAARVIAEIVVRHGNTRVLLALAQAGDEEPRLREFFRELADGIVAGAARLVHRLGGPDAAEESARLLHALSTGLAVVDLATSRPGGTQRAVAVLEVALRMIVRENRPAGPQPGEDP